MKVKDIKDVKSITWEGQCILLKDIKGNEERICYPLISDAVIDNAKIEISELHRRFPYQELTIFPKGVMSCEIKDHILRCPKGTKLEWELQEVI